MYVSANTLHSRSRVDGEKEDADVIGECLGTRLVPLGPIYFSAPGLFRYITVDGVRNAQYHGRAFDVHC